MQPFQLASYSLRFGKRRRIKALCFDRLFVDKLVGNVGDRLRLFELHHAWPTVVVHGSVTAGAPSKRNTRIFSSSSRTLWLFGAAATASKLPGAILSSLQNIQIIAPSYLLIETVSNALLPQPQAASGKIKYKARNSTIALFGILTDIARLLDKEYSDE
jgi:hypothetical protein